MPKETADNLYNLITSLSQNVGSLQSSIDNLNKLNERQVGQLHSIEQQTTKTNGRVTRLEDFVVQQLQINSRIEGLYKASQDNLKVQIKNMQDKSKRQIDEFKKQDIDILKIDKENSWKLKLAIWATISLMLTSGLTWLLTYSYDYKNNNNKEIIQ
jgi:hypothetical protein